MDRTEVGEELKLHFARHCWVNARKITPKGFTWAAVFERMHGLTLQEYRKERERENK